MNPEPAADHAVRLPDLHRTPARAVLPRGGAPLDPVHGDTAGSAFTLDLPPALGPEP